MNRIRQYWTFFLVAFLSIAGPAMYGGGDPEKGDKWEMLRLGGCTLKLRSKKSIRWYSFNDREYVSVSLGKVGEAATSDIWKWQIVGDWLNLFDLGGELVYKMRFLKKDSDAVFVKNGKGITEIFDIEREVPKTGKEESTEEGGKRIDRDPNTWAGIPLEGCIMDLESDSKVEWFLFKGDGLVSATLGLKKGNVTGPLLRWRISGKWLEIIDNDGKLLYQWRPLQIRPSQITVEDGNGEKQTFRIKR